MKERVVLVEWDDARGTGGIYDKDKPKRYEPILTKTVGFVIKSDHRSIITAEDRWLDDEGKLQYRNTSTIPKKMIRKITELKGQNGLRDSTPKRVCRLADH